MKVEIWSDVVCPWCYVGKRRFEDGLARFEHRSEVEVVWRSFELDRNAPSSHEGPYEVRLARKYGITVDQAQAMIDRMVRTAADVGLSIRFHIARPGNSFDAHRLLHLGRQRGLQGELQERLLAAVFTNGEAISDRDTLVDCAAQVGIDADEARRVLDGDSYAVEARDDEQEAARLGISSVPFFVFDRRYGIAGAHPPDVLLEALDRAWSEAHEDANTPCTRP